MQIEQIVVRCWHMGGMEMNCFLVSADPLATEVLVVDPGDEPQRILEAAGSRTISKIILTHCHPDHIGGLSRLVELTGAKVYAHTLDAPRIQNPYMDDEVLGDIPASHTVDVLLEDGDTIPVGNLTLTVLLTPGHTSGSICLYNAEDHILIAGDTLFQNAHGRTDFITGSDQQMLESLKRLATLPEETIVYPGHDSNTSIGWEKRFGVLSSFAR
jgi:glyoxylase-like metal-dependent hydrolase (beta-lactamase superfamily II)